MAEPYLVCARFATHGAWRRGQIGLMRMAVQGGLLIFLVHEAFIVSYGHSSWPVLYTLQAMTYR